MEKNNNFKSELETQYNILIKASEQKEQKRFIIIVSILSVTLLSTLISIIFASIAFNNTKKIDIENKEKNIVYYQTLTTTYNDGNILTLNNIGNGFTLEKPKIIEITNEGTTDIIFDIKLTSINTSLLSTNKLVYTLMKNNENIVSKELPLSEKVIASDIKIAPGETISYILKVTFTGTIEENNYSNYYNSKIIIEQKGNKADLLE